MCWKGGAWFIAAGCVLFIELVACPQMRAQFNWGGNGGAGTFQQQIAPQATVPVGAIPAGLKAVEIQLVSDQDVDIQLFDDQTSKALVGWRIGALIDSCCFVEKTYEGMKIAYSGWGGDGSGEGHEYIRIDQTTRVLVMKAYGFAAGHATVNYKWASGGTPAARGSGTFQQQIAHGASIVVGDIPQGLTGVEIYLLSDNDVDIQLFDTQSGAAVVGWSIGALIDSCCFTEKTYAGMNIAYSGWNGDGSGRGHEYIKIDQTTRALVMKAYGFVAGYATVNYKWGGGAVTTPKGSFYSGVYRNLFSEWLGKNGEEIRKKADDAWNKLFGSDDNYRVSGREHGLHLGSG